MQSRMNEYLSNLVVEYHKLQNFHWYVKGPDFFQVHAKLEELYDEIRDLVDDVAEVMLMEGLKPVSTMREFLSLAQIEEVEGGFISSADIYQAVEADYRLLLDASKQLKRAAEEQGSDLVAAKADNYIEHFSKAVWMLGQNH